MKTIDVGSVLEEMGLRIQAKLDAGLIGQRWTVQAIEQEAGSTPLEYVAETVDSTAGFNEMLCDNVTALLGRLEHPYLASPLSAEWATEEIFALVSDMEPDWKRLSATTFTVRDGSQFWEICRILATAVKRLHDAGLVHGAISPDTVYGSASGGVKLGDFWWTHTTSGEAVYVGASAFYGGSLPPTIKNAMAPEVVAGAPPSTASDIYSLGIVLSRLVTALQGSPVQQLVEQMTHKDASSRPTMSDLEKIIVERTGRRLTANSPPPMTFDVTNDLYLQLSIIPPELTLEIREFLEQDGAFEIALEQGDHNVWFKLAGITKYSDRVYVALSYPSYLFEDNDLEPLAVVRWVDGISVQTIGADELALMKDSMEAEIMRRSIDDLPYVRSLLGYIK